MKLIATVILTQLWLIITCQAVEDHYRDLKREDAIQFGTFLEKRPARPPSGHLSGVLKKFGLFGPTGKFIELELVDKNVKDGRIRTTKFGDLIATWSGTGLTYEVTDTQVKKIQEFSSAQAKDQVPTAKIEELEPVRPATDIEISSILVEVQRRMSPFTLEEIRQFFSPSQSRMNSSSGKSQKFLTRQRTNAIPTTNILACLTGSGAGFVEVEFHISEAKPGGDSFSDWVDGPMVLVLKQPDLSNPIGFKEVRLIDDGVFTQFEKSSDAKWTIKKYKFAER